MEWGLCSASPLSALHLRGMTKLMVLNNAKAAKPAMANAQENVMVNAQEKNPAQNQQQSHN